MITEENVLSEKVNDKLNRLRDYIYRNFLRKKANNEKTKK